MKRLTLILGAVLAASIGCAPTPAVQDSAPIPLDTGTWRLAELGGVSAVSGEEGMEPAQIRFELDSARVSGSGGCNRIFGSLATDADSLRIGPLASTRMACADEAVTRQEMAFIEALENTRRYRISGDTLSLIGDNGTLALLVPMTGR